MSAWLAKLAFVGRSGLDFHYFSGNHQAGLHSFDESPHHFPRCWWAALVDELGLQFHYSDDNAKGVSILRSTSLSLSSVVAVSIQAAVHGPRAF